MPKTSISPAQIKLPLAAVNQAVVLQHLPTEMLPKLFKLFSNALWLLQTTVTSEQGELCSTSYFLPNLYNLLCARTILITDPPVILFPRTLHSDKAAKQQLMAEPLDILDG